MSVRLSHLARDAVNCFTTPSYSGVPSQKNSHSDLADMQKIIPNRIVIFARDVKNITGRSERTSRLLLQKIRQSLGKKKGQYISVAEFCRLTGLSEEEVCSFLKK